MHRLRKGDDPAFERWKATPGADLVTAGRFDGLDMPGDVCRLVILPSVPAGFSEFERFAVAYLGDASYMRHRIGQRITQALGRANRTSDDTALYLGLDPAFAATLADTAVSSSIDADLSNVVRRALESHGSGWPPAASLAQGFWVSWLTGTPAPARPKGGGRTRPGRAAADSLPAGDSADAEVTAVTRLWLGDHAGAASAAGQAADLLHAAGETEHSAFWRYVQAHAYYERIGGPDTGAARRCVEQAIAAAPNTAWFVRLRRTAEALAGRATSPAGHDGLFLAWDDWIRETGPRPRRGHRTAPSLAPRHPRPTRRGPRHTGPPLWRDSQPARGSQRRRRAVGMGRPPQRPPACLGSQDRDTRRGAPRLGQPGARADHGGTPASPPGHHLRVPAHRHRRGRGGRPAGSPRRDSNPAHRRRAGYL